MGLFKFAKTKNTRTSTKTGTQRTNRKGGALKSITETSTNNGYRVTTNILTGKQTKRKI